MSNMRKSTIYALLALLVWTMAVPATAQKKQQRSMKNLDPEATVEALAKLLKTPYPFNDLSGEPGEGNVNLIETEIYPQFKKNADMLTKIGHAFEFYKNDRKNAFKYLDRALAVDSNHVPTYVEMGRIKFAWAKTHEDSLEAFGCLGKAISVNPKDSLGYYAYARALAKKHDYDGAAKKLEEILQHDPNYNVYVEIGRIYGEAGLENMDNEFIRKSIDCYSKADLSRMTVKQIQLYLTMLHTVGSSGGGIGAYNRADSILNLVLPKYPRNAELNRRMLINDVSLKRYDHALVAADNLFNNSDSLKVTIDDYILNAEAYIGLKRYNDAINVYRKALDVEIDSTEYKSKALYKYDLRQEEKKKNNAVFAIADAYDKSGYTDKAIDEMKAFITKREKLGELDAPEVQKLANYYLSATELEMNPDVKKSMYMEAYNLYGRLAEVSPDYADFAYFTRVQIIWQYIDTESKEGLAVSDAEKVLQFIPLTEEAGLSNAQKVRLRTVLSYLSRHYYYKSLGTKSYVDRMKCGSYLKKLVILNPEDALYKILSEDRKSRKLYGL